MVHFGGSMRYIGTEGDLTDVIFRFFHICKNYRGTLYSLSKANGLPYWMSMYDTPLTLMSLVHKTLTNKNKAFVLREMS